MLAKGSDYNQAGKYERNRTGMQLFVGVSMILFGLMCNKWVLEWIFARLPLPEALLYIGPLKIALLFIAQVILIVAGVRVISGQRVLPASGTGRKIYWTVLAASALLFGYGAYNTVPVIFDTYLATPTKVDTSEDVIDLLTSRIKGLGKSLKNLALPDLERQSMFADSVIVRDVVFNKKPKKTELVATSVGVEKWSVSSEAGKYARESVNIWQPLLEQVAFFKQAKFKVTRGDFLNKDETLYETTVWFTGYAQLKNEAADRLSGNVLATVKGVIEVHWARSKNMSKDSLNSWQISEWHVKKLNIYKSENELFTEVLNRALLDRGVLKRARISQHEKLAIQYIKGEIEKPKFFDIPNRRPGIAIVDLNHDGYDDFFVMTRWGESMFFQNEGDGSFREAAADYGLNILDHNAAGVFADFDNDGDSDLFLGRTWTRSLYLVNENGRFVDRSEEMVAYPLPYFVSSVSVVDYNNDGLLDVYISTYGKKGMIQKAKEEGIDDCISPGDLQELDSLLALKESHQILNKRGLPNLLLKNVGNGKFEEATDAKELKAFRPTFQATWSDYDDDGDPDVYLANDYGPNNFFRNDGNGRFTDIAEKNDTRDVGFGMGAAWGDYDNNGEFDLYVTNMYSKAGMRIVAQTIPEDERYRKMPRGNSLFRNTNGSFQKVSGLAPPSLEVEMGNWGWGSQFIDVDNDGYLDIYALSGYYTAAPAVANSGDI